MNEKATEEQSFENEDYISKIMPNSYAFEFDEDLFCHIIKLRLKRKIKGVACWYCNLTEDNFRDNKIFFCKTKNIFLCYDCIIDKHKFMTNLRNREHHDYKVKVEIEEE